MKRSPRRHLVRYAASLAIALAFPAFGAAPARAPGAPAKGDDSAYQQLIDAANAVVAVKTKALAGARSSANLGEERTGSGVLIAPSGMVLTIGYLILEADTVDITTNQGRTVPATVAAYDHATGFGLLRPIGPLDVKPIKLGASRAVGELDRMMIAAGGGEDSVSIATVVSRREFAGYWEYLLDEALFTSPAHPQWSGAALLDAGGRLIGIGSLLVQQEVNGEQAHTNMFVPVELIDTILDDLVRNGRSGRAPRPWLGLYTQEADGNLAVGGVAKGGPAERAGVQTGDLVLGVAGTRAHSLAEFYRLVWSQGTAGVEVPLSLARAGDVLRVSIKSANRNDLLKKPDLH